MTDSNDEKKIDIMRTLDCMYPLSHARVLTVKMPGAQDVFNIAYNFMTSVGVLHTAKSMLPWWLPLKPGHLLLEYFEDVHRKEDNYGKFKRALKNSLEKQISVYDDWTILQMTVFVLALCGAYYMCNRGERARHSWKAGSVYAFVVLMYFLTMMTDAYIVYDSYVSLQMVEIQTFEHVIVFLVACSAYMYVIYRNKNMGMMEGLSNIKHEILEHQALEIQRAKTYSEEHFHQLSEACIRNTEDVAQLRNIIENLALIKKKEVEEAAADQRPASSRRRRPMNTQLR